MKKKIQSTIKQRSLLKATIKIKKKRIFRKKQIRLTELFKGLCRAILYGLGAIAKKAIL